MSKKKKWSLSKDEVSHSISSASRNRRYLNISKSSRSKDERSSEIILTHKPTGVEVRGEIPRGHYSRKEMQSLKSKLMEQLFIELEIKVARFLRIPGR